MIEPCENDLFWKKLFEGNWYLVKVSTRNINILGLRHIFYRIERWCNDTTDKEKIITHKWEDGKCITKVRLRSL